MKKIMALLLIVFLVAPIRSSIAGDKTYRIATVAWIGWSTLHVADELGFWEELDVKVQVVDYDDPIIILEAIKAGRIDFAMDMAGTVAGVYMNGNPVVVLAETNWSHGGDKIIVKQGRSISDHAGETIGIFLKQPAGLYFLNSYLETEGLSVSDFRIVEIGSEPLTAQFIAGRIPVIVNYDPWALMAVRGGNGRVLATSADFPGCIPECIWGFKGHLDKIPAKDIEKIIEGLIKASIWINNSDNWSRYKKILNKRTFKAHPEYSDHQLREFFDNVRIHRPETMLVRNRDGGGLYDYFRSLHNFLKNEGMLEKDFKPETIFDNRHVMKVLDKYKP